MFIVLLLLLTCILIIYK